MKIFHPDQLPSPNSDKISFKGISDRAYSFSAPAPKKDFPVIPIVFSATLIKITTKSKHCKQILPFKIFQKQTHTHTTIFIFLQINSLTRV